MGRLAADDEFRISKEQLLWLAAQGRKFEPRTIEMMERICVFGEAQRSVAERYEVSPQYLSKTKQLLKKRMQEMSGPGLMMRTVCVHKSLLPKLRRLEADSKALAKGKK